MLSIFGTRTPNTFSSLALLILLKAKIPYQEPIDGQQIGYSIDLFFADLDISQGTPTTAEYLEQMASLKIIWMTPRTMISSARIGPYRCSCEFWEVTQHNGKRSGIGMLAKIQLLIQAVMQVPKEVWRKILCSLAVSVCIHELASEWTTVEIF